MEIVLIAAVVALFLLGLKPVDRAIDYQVGVFSRLIGGWKADGWPVGVQGEDRDRPWGNSAGRKPIAQPPGAVQPVASVVHRRR